MRGEVLVGGGVCSAEGCLVPGNAVSRRLAEAHTHAGTNPASASCLWWPFRAPEGSLSWGDQRQRFALLPGDACLILVGEPGFGPRPAFVMKSGGSYSPLSFSVVTVTSSANSTPGSPEGHPRSGHPTCCLLSSLPETTKQPRAAAPAHWGFAFEDAVLLGI